MFQKTYTDSQFNRHHNYGERDRYFVENHHPAIVSRETFEAVAAVIGQRAKEKGVTREGLHKEVASPFGFVISQND